MYLESVSRRGGRHIVNALPALKRRRPLRVFYAAGPGHVIGTFVHWRTGRDDPSEPTVTHSSQFYDICRELNARGYVITACPYPGRLSDGTFQIEHRPYRLKSASGLLYHLGQFCNGIRLMASAIRFRSDVAIIAEGSYWFLFVPLNLLGIKVIPALMNVVVRKEGRSAFLRCLIARSNGWFFRHHCCAIISHSRALTDELETLTNKSHGPVMEFLPLYRTSTFAGIPLPDPLERPFRVLFVGRIEASKGVFDLLSAARQLSKDRNDIVFHLCGEGSDLVRLQNEATAAGIADRFLCHGQCDRAGVIKRYGQCHVVIVPTRAELGEGFNHVTAEAVLAGRPVIASSVIPAIEYIGESATAVSPGDVDGYMKAILRLADDPVLYTKRQKAAAAARAQFYDESRSFGAALRRALRLVD